MNRYLPGSLSPLPSSRYLLKQGGYSLYDLIITSAVASVLGVGAMGMSSLVQDARMAAGVNKLMTELSLARSEAIKRRSAITLCASTTSNECQSSRKWHDGWIMFWDPNGNGRLEPGESILRVQDSPAIKSLNFGAWGPGTGQWVTYEADGSTKQNGTFTFCDSRGAAKAKAVILLGTGRPRVSALNASGDPLNCT
ncbi:GspH/FimT family pseudopilin [Sulfuricaulis sp.]|uniref:GspH/FimT family pseudopilin n=1 Tax=Sulfuricaulis sp. TaxID=2003553 RepID=UPI00355AA39E